MVVVSAMAQVTVTVNNRQYRMACEDGQEAHVMRLAMDLDRRIQELRTKFGEIGDMRLAVMAALMIADELVEVGKRLRQVEEQFGSLQSARAAAVERSHLTNSAIASALNSAAERIERATMSLNQTLGDTESVPLG